MKPPTSRSPLLNKACFFLVLLMLVLGAGEGGAASAILSSLDGSAARAWNREDRHAVSPQVIQTRHLAPRQCVKQSGGQGAALPPRVSRPLPSVPTRILASPPQEHLLPRLSDFRGMLPLPCAPPCPASLI